MAPPQGQENSQTIIFHISEHSDKSAISLSLMVLPFPTQARL